MHRLIAVLLMVLMAGPAYAGGSTVLKPLRNTGFVLGGIAAGGLALACAERPECMPNFKKGVRKFKEAAAGGSIYEMGRDQREKSMQRQKFRDQTDSLPPWDPNGRKEEGRKSSTVQTGGNTLDQKTVDSLNRNLGDFRSRDEWRRAVESLKQSRGLGNDHHGRILANGNYLGMDGRVLGNLKDWLR